MQNAAPSRNDASGYNVERKPAVRFSGDYGYRIVLDQCWTSRQKGLLPVVVIGFASTISCMEKLRQNVT